MKDAKEPKQVNSGRPVSLRFRACRAHSRAAFLWCIVLGAVERVRTVAARSRKFYERNFWCFCVGNNSRERDDCIRQRPEFMADQSEREFFFLGPHRNSAAAAAGLRSASAAHFRIATTACLRPPGTAYIRPRGTTNFRSTSAAGIRTTTAANLCSPGTARVRPARTVGFRSTTATSFRSAGAANLCSATAANVCPTDEIVYPVPADGVAPRSARKATGSCHTARPAKVKC
jgi:hypothetical protein